jgi:hypothetical protein
MILKLIRQLIRKIRGQKEESRKPVRSTDIDPYRELKQRHYPIPKSRDFKPRPAYEKRAWKSTKKMPKNFKDEDED